MPNPKFDDQLTVTPDGRAVDAGGPNWDPDDVEWMEISGVTIAQGDEIVAWSTGTTRVDRGRHSKWWLEAASDGRLMPGPARAEAIAIKHHKGGRVSRFPWFDDVQVVEIGVDEQRETPLTEELDAEVKRRTAPASAKVTQVPGRITVEWT